jgi:uncharacterized protein YwgA
MSANPDTTVKLGVLARLAQEVHHSFGRTALMKLCYFLQVLKGVPLGYEFTLYSYGPFDSEVLSDLQTAESLSILESSLTHFSGGYSYQITASDNAEQAVSHASKFLASYKGEIQWVASNFGSRTASELELLSTIVFVNRQDNVSDKNVLMNLVKAIKPQFSEAEILKKIEWLRRENLLGQPRG